MHHWIELLTTEARIQQVKGGVLEYDTFAYEEMHQISVRHPTCHGVAPWHGKRNGSLVPLGETIYKGMTTTPRLKSLQAN